MKVDVVARDESDDDAPSVEVRVACSVTRAKCPDPGVHSAPFLWRDVVDGAPPRRRRRGGGMHLTYHTTEHAPDVRLSHATIVRVDPGADLDSPFDDVVHVDERVFVQRRALQELIDREKAFSDRLAVRLRSRLGKSVARQRRAMAAIKVAWVVTVLAWLVRMEAKAGFALIRGLRAFLRSLVHIPDAALAKSAGARTHLASRVGRRHMWRALRDPSSASNEEKGVVVVVLTVLLIGSFFLLNNVFLFLPEAWAAAYRHVEKDAALNLLSVLALPIPAEILIVASTIAVGPVLAFTGLFLGKMVGSWLLYLVGDSLHAGLEKQTATKPRMKRIVDWLKARADRQGGWLLFIINAIPLMPDLLVYPFAVSGMRFRPYMLGIGLGTAAKYAGLIAAVLYLGPERVRDFLAAPFG